MTHLYHLHYCPIINLISFNMLMASSDSHYFGVWIYVVHRMQMEDSAG